MSQKEDSFARAVVNESPNARRNEIVLCPAYGVEMARKKLKEELRKTITASVRVDLERKISTCNKAIKDAPKPKRSWSPILSGSFESGK